jgi:hypothetical protein
VDAGFRTLQVTPTSLKQLGHWDRPVVRMGEGTPTQRGDPDAVTLDALRFAAAR